jgi:hypothetical protein
MAEDSIDKFIGRQGNSTLNFRSETDMALITKE